MKCCKPYYKLLLLLKLISMSMNICSQNPSDQFDSLQSIIKKEIGTASNNFETEAKKYEQLAVEINDTLKIAKGKNFQGLFDYFKGRNTAAIAKYLDALKLFYYVNDTFYIALTNNNIGAAYALRGNPDKSIQYYKEALTLFQHVQDTFWTANMINNIAIQFTVKENHNEALKYFEEAFNIYKNLGDSTSVGNILVNEAYNYIAIHQEPKAATILETFHQFYENYVDNETLSNAWSGQARISLQKLDLKSSEKFALKSLQIRRENELKNSYAKSYALLSEIKEKQKDFNAALSYYKLFTSYTDSLWSKEKDQNINELMTQYDVEKKEIEIAGLHKENEAKKETITRLYSKYKLYLGGFLLLLIATSSLAYLLYFRSKLNAELKKKNETIAQNLKEKDILLKEIHHRVKNNLQVVSSLLNLQSNYIEDEIALEAINEGKNRVSSMALIHQNLYTDADITTIETTQYFGELIDQLFDSYNIREQDITLEKNIASLRLDVDTMVPLGLIANELISNALKHAFDDNINGQLIITLQEVDNELHLSIKDNGKGMLENDFYLSESFGNKMIAVFIQKLEASLDIRQQNGTEFLLKIKEYKKAA